MAHLLESMFYAGETPWHKLGTKVAANLPWQDAIVAAGLDWTVGLRDTFTYYRGDMIPALAQAVMRETDGRVLGSVSDGYAPIQNREAFALFGELFGDAAVLNTAGSLKGGATVWGLAEIPGDYAPAGDKHKRYVLCTTSHDGTRSLRALPTAVRVVCNNTLTMALRDLSECKSVRHSGDVQGKIATTGKTLAGILKGFDTFADQAETLASRRLTAADAMAVLKTVFGDSKRAESSIADAAERSVYGPGNATHKGTAWALLQGVTEHVDHARQPRADAERRVTYQTLGSGAEMKRKTLTLLLDAPEAPAGSLLDAVLAVTE
jgi:phage/plasmid-like protein (TIGR03299 family)